MPTGRVELFSWLFRKRGSRKDTSPETGGLSPAAVAVGSPSLLRQVEVAIEHHRAGRRSDAEQACRTALAGDPENPDALHLLGILAFERGDHDEAATLISRSVSRNGNNILALFNLGRVYEARGELPQAEVQYRNILSLAPQDAAVHHVLGDVLCARQQDAAAITHYRQALQIRHDFPEAHLSLGNMLKTQGRVDEAISSYAEAVRLKPNFAQAQLRLGIALREQRQFDRAVTHFEAAVALRPDLKEAQAALGDLYINEDRREEALLHFRTALALDPEFAAARWGHAMAQLQAVCGPDDDPTRGRAAFMAELDEFICWCDGNGIETAAKAVGNQQPFLLAYQEHNNRDLLEKYGALCVRLMSQSSAGAAYSIPVKRTAGRPMRVAIVSSHFRNHSVWHAFVKGWFQHLNRERFSLHAFYLRADEDAETAIAKSRAAHFELGKRDLGHWADSILSQRPDVVIYPEVGMDPMTLRLACLRLAPVQVASWGHPETTGLPTIDYYLSAQDFEPQAAQDHYSEQLVALPHLGCSFELVGINPASSDLERWGIEPDVPVLISPGTPFKYAPEHDHIFPDIALRLHRCRFVFFAHWTRDLSERLHRRLEVAFSRVGLDAEEYVRFIPWLTRPAFYGMLQRADAYLDTIGFSGFNTAMQAIECGLPIVTCDGRFMRGRFASGILKRLGMPELVTENKQEYIALAAKLIKDVEFHASVRECIVARRGTLFRDQAPIRALEEFLVKATDTAIR